VHVGGIFYDWAKAFDFVYHSVSLAKLHFYGIWGVSEDWFRSFWTNGKERDEV